MFSRTACRSQKSWGREKSLTDIEEEREEEEEITMAENVSKTVSERKKIWNKRLFRFMYEVFYNDTYFEMKEYKSLETIAEFSLEIWRQTYKKI